MPFHPRFPNYQINRFRCSGSETTRRFEVRHAFALTIVQCIVSATGVFESIAKKSQQRGTHTKNYDNPDLELQLPITASVENSTPTSMNMKWRWTRQIGPTNALLGISTMAIFSFNTSTNLSPVSFQSAAKKRDSKVFTWDVTGPRHWKGTEVTLNGGKIWEFWCPKLGTRPSDPTLDDFWMRTATPVASTWAFWKICSASRFSRLSFLHACGWRCRNARLLGFRTRFW